jgi:hypothetical protein
MTHLLRAFACALVLQLGLFVGAPAKADPVYQSSTIACTKSAQFSGGAATTVLVTNVPNQRIYVCGFVFAGTAAGTAGLEYGTSGTTCGSPTLITPVFAVGATANPAIVDHQTYYAGLPPAPSGNDLCVVTTGTGTQIIIYYSQF